LQVFANTPRWSFCITVNLEPSKIRILRHTDGTEYACNQIDGGTKLSPYLSSGSRYGWRRKTQRTSSSLRQLPAPWLYPVGGLFTCWSRLTCCCCLPAGPQGGRKGGEQLLQVVGGGSTCCRRGGRRSVCSLLCWRSPPPATASFQGGGRSYYTPPHTKTRSTQLEGGLDLFPGFFSLQILPPWFAHTRSAGFGIVHR